VELFVCAVGLAERPPRRHDAVEDDGLAAGGGDREAESLAGQSGEALPIGAPVPRHLDPPRAGPLHRHARYRPASGHVGHQHQLEVVEPVDSEPHASTLPALHPEDGNNAGLVDADVLPGGLGHVEVRAGRVAPAAFVAGEVPVGRAEVGGRHGDRLAEPAPVGRLGGVADDEVALPARRAAVEQRCAQRRVVDA
uniref:Uncharacterized protein n=1 Tax=Oryza brachyantha TaxID=4533 RepID=J3LK53_ORYBR